MTNKNPGTATDWLLSVADKAKVTRETAQAVLEKHGIQPQPTLPRARHLWVRSVELDGTKEGPFSTGPLHLDWTNLGPGLWALMSDQNSRGKSSVLNVIRSALKGDFPGIIKADVWKWLSRAEVAFNVDNVRFRVLIEKEAGEERPAAARARFSRAEGDLWVDIYDGPAGDNLQSQVEYVCMEELGFARFQAFNSDTETGRSHGWPAISSALFVSDPGQAIFGDHRIDALPLRLIQMFVGLPWVSTMTAAQTALKQVQADVRRRSAKSEEGTGRLQTRLAAVEEQITAARSRLSAGPDRPALRRELLAYDTELTDADADLRTARGRLADLENELGRAVQVWNAARRLLQQVSDEVRSGLIFRRLRPVCCPACEADVGGRYEASDAACALCGSDQQVDEEGDDRLSSLEGDAADAEATVQRLRAEVAAAERQLRGAEQRRKQAEREIARIQPLLKQEDDTALEMQVAGLEARASELRELLSETASPGTSESNVEPHVLEAAEEASKAMFEDLQREVLADVSEAITRLARKFGVANVEKMELRSNGALIIQQGGTSTSFTKLAAGERLRVRVAAALAVVEVGRKRGYGRHPGLLILDSPGAQEMKDSDFAALLASVQATVTETEGFQIIVGAVARPELLTVVPFEHRVHAKGEAYLF